MDFRGSFFVGSENPSVHRRTRVFGFCKNAEKARIASHNFAFEITLSQAITLALLLVCAFSPRVHSIPRGPLTLKSQNFDGFLTFLGKFLRGRVLWRT